jgi:protein-tyrosine phosphatase
VPPKVRLCFVCLGNICRSPTAAGVMRHLVRGAGLESQIEVESAGTSGYHIGQAPDARACAAGLRREIEVSGAARQFSRTDFDRFYYVLAMDRDNFDNLIRLATPSQARKVFLLRRFDPSAPPDAAVPDPYYGDEAEFDEVVEQCLSACRGLLEHIQREHRLR